MSEETEGQDTGAGSSGAGVEPAAAALPTSADKVSSLWRQLKEHRIVQWSIGYIAVAYGVQHAVVLTSEAYDWPNIIARVSMTLLALGLPIAMTLAWYHGERASRGFSRAEMTIVALLLMTGSLLFYLFIRPSGEPAEKSLAQQAAITGNPDAAVSPKGAASIAVLPFANMSGDAGQEFFSDGMTEEITAALAKVPGLRVVARTSAFAFKGQARDIQTIGQKLHATYLIEGSVRKAADRVRVTVQLIKAAEGTHLWAESYDRQLTDIFAIQEDIARTITTSLQVPLGLKPGQNLVSNRTVDVEAYQQYLRARALYQGRGLKGLTDAAALLEPLLARDPNYAPAWTLLAQTYELIPNFNPAWFGGDFEKLRPTIVSVMPKADGAAHRAVALDPEFADGYVALAQVQDLQGQYVEAEDLYRKALALDPNSPEALHYYSRMLAGAGRLKEALSMRQRLSELDPFAPVYNSVTAWILWLNGRNDEAIATAQGVSTPFIRGYTLPIILAANGRFKDAADAIGLIPGGNFPPEMVESATRLLRTAPTKTGSPQALPKLGMFAFVYLYVGAPDRVLDAFEGGVRDGYAVSLYNAYLWHPSYAALRKAERFKAFLRKAGYVKYWRARGWPDFCYPAGTDDFACS